MQIEFSDSVQHIFFSDFFLYFYHFFHNFNYIWGWFTPMKFFPEIEDIVFFIPH